MKFSRQKMQHLKWLRRKELIRINCFIMIAILLMVLLFMGFPIVSDAADYDDFNPTDYVNFCDYFDITTDDLLIDSSVDKQDGYTYMLYSDSFASYFDGDRSNGELVFSDYAFNHSVNVTGVADTSLRVADCTSMYLYYYSNQFDLYCWFYDEPVKYRTFQESSSVTQNMLYIDHAFNSNGNNNYFIPSKNYVLRISFNSTLDDDGYTVYKPTSFNTFNNYFGGNQRYFVDNSCYYGIYGNASKILWSQNITYEALTTSHGYLKRASYRSDPNDNTSAWVTDWLIVNDFQDYTPFTGSGVNPSSVLDNDYIGTGNFMYGNGSAINNFDLKIGVDFNEDQMRNISDYSYQLDCNLKATYNLAKHLGSNAETQLLSSYGLSFGSGDAIVVNQDFYFTINDNFSSNYFSIPSSVFNDGLVQSGHTAIPLVNYIWQYCPASTVTNKVEAFYDSISQATIGPFSLPGYSETNYFANCNIKYDFVMNIYNKDGDQINSLPLALSYDPMTGEQNMYSNGGGVPHDQVKDIVDNHNENKDPTDTDYLPPSNYNPTLTPSTSNNDNSSNSTSYGGAVSVVNNPSITIQQGNKYPEKGVMQSFIRIINNDKNNTVNDIDTLIGGSAYIQLMNNALVAVPDQVWSIWITALKAILGIAVSAFFLKILINWAT